MKTIYETYGFNAFRRDLQQYFVEYARLRKLGDHVKDLEDKVSIESANWLRARGLGKRQTSADFARRFLKDAASMDIEKAVETLSGHLDDRGDEIDKSITNLSELAAGTVKTGLGAWAMSPDGISEGIGLLDKIRKVFVNPHQAKEEELSSIRVHCRRDMIEAGERIFAHTLMGLNSAAFKLNLRLKIWDIPGGRCDFVDRFKSEHADGMLLLKDVLADIPQMQVQMVSAKKRAERMLKEKGRFGVELAIAASSSGIAQGSVNATQHVFQRHHTERLSTVPLEQLERGYMRLAEILEATDLELQAIGHLRTMAGSDRRISLSMTRPETLLSTIRDACSGKGYRASADLQDKEVSVNQIGSELGVAHLIVRAQGLRHPEMREGSRMVVEAIKETAGYLKTIKRSGIDTVRMSGGPSDEDFFTRLRDEVRWQYEPVKAALDEDYARELAERKEDFSGHAREKIAERLSAKMVERIQATLQMAQERETEDEVYVRPPPRTRRPR